MDNQDLVKITKEGAGFTLDLKKGGKLLSLVLCRDNTQIQVIESNGDILGSGSYLMYPWVNRLRSEKLQIPENSLDLQVEPVFRDQNNIPLHGLYVNRKRRIVSKGEDYITMEPVEIDQRFPSFLETFRLISNHQLQITIEFHNQSSQIQAFAFGYHPYIQLDTKIIDHLHVRTNHDQYIVVDDKLLPVNDHVQFGQLKDIFHHKGHFGETKLDNGLASSTEHDKYYVELFDPKDAYGVRVVSNTKHDADFINLKFWQIYTPPDRKRIAIEPQSSTADAFALKGSGLVTLEPGQKKYSSFVIETFK